MWERLTTDIVLPILAIHDPPPASSTVGIELVKRPSLILLDEPLSGATPSSPAG